MPFKSEAQRRKFAQKLADGEITQETFDKWNKDTPRKLPERVGQKLPAEVKPIKIQG